MTLIINGYNRVIDVILTTVKKQLEERMGSAFGRTHMLSVAEQEFPENSLNLYMSYLQDQDDVVRTAGVTRIERTNYLGVHISPFLHKNADGTSDLLLAAMHSSDKVEGYVRPIGHSTDIVTLVKNQRYAGRWELADVVLEPKTDHRAWRLPLMSAEKTGSVKEMANSIGWYLCSQRQHYAENGATNFAAELLRAIEQKHQHTSSSIGLRYAVTDLSPGVQGDDRETGLTVWRDDKIIAELSMVTSPGRKPVVENGPKQVRCVLRGRSFHPQTGVWSSVENLAVFNCNELPVDPERFHTPSLEKIGRELSANFMMDTAWLGVNFLLTHTKDKSVPIDVHGHRSFISHSFYWNVSGGQADYMGLCTNGDEVTVVQKTKVTKPGYEELARFSLMRDYAQPGGGFKKAEIATAEIKSELTSEGSDMVLRYSGNVTVHGHGTTPGTVTELQPTKIALERKEEDGTLSLPKNHRVLMAMSRLGAPTMEQFSSAAIQTDPRLAEKGEENLATKAVEDLIREVESVAKNKLLVARPAGSNGFVSTVLLVCELRPEASPHCGVAHFRVLVANRFGEESQEILKIAAIVQDVKSEKEHVLITDIANLKEGYHLVEQAKFSVNDENSRGRAVAWAAKIVDELDMAATAHIGATTNLG